MGLIGEGALLEGERERRKGGGGLAVVIFLILFFFFSTPFPPFPLGRWSWDQWVFGFGEVFSSPFLRVFSSLFEIFSVGIWGDLQDTDVC